MVFERAANQHTDAKRHHAGSHHIALVVPPHRAIAIVAIDIDRRAVDHARVVARHIHHLWVCRFDGDDLRRRRNTFAIQNRCHHHMSRHLDLLLRRTAQMTAGLSTLTHDLHRVEDIVGVMRVRITQGAGPIEIAGQLVHHIGEGGQCLDAGIPRLRHGGLRAVGGRQVAIAVQPILRSKELIRVDRRRQGLG
ncbi:hypothetical protein XVE_4772 [Xanthomonas vesicatoria ATCC 35937]|uniref:Uncharacterized protein n=1 Tax=Xanthomonas vesicatoria ATCC 35937 TaxID=925775 RepID=F0BKF7_9XANT|nr:hypothetical protein XVE_4772 [Xanthomonas vesicatoria ATCC 35937]